jgi:predicted amidohydrolase YtcJ
MTASLVLLNGRLWSPDGSGAGCDAVVITGGRIAAVTAAADARELAGRAARVIDLKGRLAIPAFGDAHVHPVSGGLESLRCNLLGMGSRAEYLAAIARYARGLGTDEWVLGGGWAMAAFPRGVPSAADLDEAAAGRPVFLPNRDHHSAWVSSAALAVAGITRDTPDPPDGRIERDERGEPSGALHEGAMRLVSRMIPPPSAADLAAGLRAALRHLHSLGITHWQDAIVGDAPDVGIPDAFQAYRAAAAEGWLTAQVTGALWWDRRRGLGQIAALLGRREEAGTGAFRATSVKIMVDGVCETLTAAMTEPYEGQPPGHERRGTLFIEPDELAEAVRQLDREGFQVHFHALGDRAVHVALDALAAAGVPGAGGVIAGGARSGGAGPAPDLRHHLAHLQFIRPDDLDRFRTIGAVANFQPLWACNEPQMTELTLPVVGPERAAWQYRIGELARRGTRIAFGSDWPVSSADPLQEIHVAVNRRLSPELGTPGTAGTEQPFLPEEAVTATEALTAFTAGVAYVNHRDTELGSLRPGSRADIAVLSRDILAIPPGEIGGTRVDLTIAGGQVVHGDELAVPAGRTGSARCYPGCCAGRIPGAAIARFLSMSSPDEATTCHAAVRHAICFRTVHERGRPEVVIKARIVTSRWGRR